MSGTKDRKLLPPYTKDTKDKPVIDWDALTNMYLHQNMTAKDFLAQFRNIDMSKKRSLQFLKKFEDERNKQRSKNYYLRRNVQSLADNNLIDDTSMFRHIELLKTRQALKDYDAVEVVQHAFLAKARSPHVTINELAVISKGLEICQKIQRIALGMEGNETGQEPLQNKPDEDKSNVETPDNTPTYVVQMNDNGKFKTLKPRRIK